ncbi:hypothetical protein ABZ208_15945 [Streptomyces sp. NPDC006208]|uniref:hypothetical protein n=1 Tax=Streptomyces sp. NPDC006208 TaxID=3156734 RepID=UPI0033AFB4A1
MATLRIEHAITDLDTWKSGFDRFADFRRHAGVRAYRVMQPLDDPHYIAVDLDFDTAAAAENFRDALVEKIWATSETARALVGTPKTRILEIIEER